MMPEQERPMHILVVHHTTFPDYIHGGVDAMLTALLPEIPRQGHRVSVFIPGRWEDRQWQSREHEGINIHRQRIRLPWTSTHPVRNLLGWLVEFPGLLWRLARLLRRERVNLIHLHTLQVHQYPFRILRMLGGPPYIITLHGTDIRCLNQKSGFQAAIIRWILRGATQLTAVSRELRHQAEAALGPHPPVRFIPNGIDPNRCSTLQPPQPLPLSLPERYFVQISDLEPVKGVDISVRAWADVITQRPDLHLVIIGRTDQIPPFTAELRAMVATLGLNDHLHFTGKLSHGELFSIARRAQGLLFPSRAEGMPYVLLEAGSLGLPVVCSDIPACKDLIEHAREGLLFPSEDHAAMARAILDMARDSENAERMGQSLRQKIANHHSAAAMTSKYLELYQEILNHAPWMGR